MPVLLPKHEQQVLDPPKLTHIQIVCGNATCSGTESKPRRTVLTTAGNCFHCGGRSYELASVMFPPRQWFWRDPGLANLINSITEDKQCEKVKVGNPQS